MPIRISLPQEDHVDRPAGESVIYEVANEGTCRLPAIELIPATKKGIQLRSLRVHSASIAGRELRAINRWLSRCLPTRITKPVCFRYPEKIKVKQLGSPSDFTISGRYANAGLFSFGSTNIKSTAVVQFDDEPATDGLPSQKGDGVESDSDRVDSPPSVAQDVSMEPVAGTRKEAVIVEPTEFIIVPNKEAELRITVRGGADCGPPVVSLEPDTDNGASPFALALDKVNAFLKMRPPRMQGALSAGFPAQRQDGEEIVWYQDIRIDISEAEERRLRESGTVVRQLKIEVAGLDPILHPVRIAEAADGPTIEYPGWVSIDYGTSYSTVTVFDPHHVRPLVGLPREQFDRLCRSVIKTLEATRKPQSENEHGLSADLCESWNEMLKVIGDQISDQGGRRVIENAFRSGEAARCYVILGRLESRLAETPFEELRLWGLKWLHALFADVFRVPPLEALNLRPVGLSVNSDGSTAREISSELEVTQLRPLRVEMGVEAHQIPSEIDLASEAPVRSFRTLKRYIGQDKSFLVEAGEQVERVSAEELVQGAWRTLRERSDEHRRRFPEEFSKGEFTRAILTYPTVSPPAVRRQYEKYGRDLFPTMVWTDYDEAVSSAIFYLMRDYDLGGSLQVGLDTFKSRSHPMPGEHPTSWSHHVLVFDIGGGTTDLALIELTLEVDDPLAKEGEGSRGGHGRYYRMTPKLLGSTGHLQLGGQLITLRVFQAMKVLLADKLLACMDAFPVDVRRAWLNEIGMASEGEETFMAGEQYREGAIADLSNLMGRHRQYALDVADAVIPTRWRGTHRETVTESSGPSRVFALLWEYAEAAKIHLGSSTGESHEASSEFSISAKDCQEIVTACGYEMPEELEAELQVVLTREQFEMMVQPVIHEAAMLAKGLVETRLCGGLNAGREQPQLDWLILSGKSCNLDLVMRELRAVLTSLPYFTWNRERITFDPEFAKLSTSIGACYAERLRQFAFDREAAVKFMRKGLDQLEFDIKNLFFFLPCSFTRMVPFGEEPVTEIFQVGTELYQLDSEPVGKARTAWDRMTLQLTVLRKDYEGGTPHQWGTFIAERLREDLQITREDLRRNVWVQFEVDHRQQFRLYLCRWDEAEAPSFPLASENASTSGFPAFHEGPAHFLVSADGRNVVDAAMAIDGSKTPLVSKDEHGAWVLNYRIAVGVVTSMANTGHEETVFEAGSRLTERFHSEGLDARPTAGIIAPSPLDTYYQNGTMFIHARDEGCEDGWLLLGKLGRPKASEFPPRCYLTLNEHGAIQLHEGAVPYKKASTPKEMWSNPGFVYQTNLELAPTESDPQRDPFSGIH